MLRLSRRLDRLPGLGSPARSLLVIASLVLAAAGLLSSASAQPPQSITAGSNIVHLPVVANQARLGEADPGGGDSSAAWTNFSSTTGSSAVAVAPGGAVVWTASWGGAVRWDLAAGAPPQAFRATDGLLSNAQWDVAVDPSGGAWLASDDGISRWTPDGEWTVYSSDDYPVLDQARAVAVAPDGAVYAGGWGGLARFDGESRWEKVPGTPGAIVEDIAFGKDGRVWLATSQGAAVGPASGGDWRAFAEADGLVGRYGRAVLVDAAGNAWIGTANDSCAQGAADCGGVTRIAPDDTITGYRRADGLGMNAVQAIAEDGDGSLWFGGWRGVSGQPTAGYTTDGLSRLAPDGTWSQVAATNELPLDQVLDLAVDNRGGVWAATQEGLVNNLDRNWTTWDTRAIDTLPVDDYRASVVFDSLTGPDGRLWLGTLAGVLLREPDGAWRHFPIDGDSEANFVEALELDEAGDLWVGTRHGLYILQPGAGLTWREPSGGRWLIDGWITDIAAAPDGTLWVGTQSQGASRRDPGGGWTLFGDFILPDDYISDIEIGPGGITWIATPSGVVRVGPGDTVVELGGADQPACQTRDIGIDPQGAVWFGPNGFGCSTISRRTADGIWSHFEPAQHGLSSVADIAVDAAGGVWFGSWEREGVSVFHGDRFDGTWRHYTTRDGLSHGNVWAVSTAPAADGGIDVWFGTFAGVTRLHLTAAESGPQKPTATPPPTPTPTPTAKPDPGADLPVIRGRWSYLTNGNGVIALDVDRASGTVWVGTVGGLVAWDPVTGTSTKYTVADGLPQHAISALKVAGDGTIWLGTRRSGAVRRLPDGRFETFSMADGLLDNDVLAIEIDPAGNVWFGTGLGVSRRGADGRWERFHYSSNQVASTIRSIAFGADGTGYFGSYASGVSIRRPDGRWEQLTVRRGLGSDQIAAVAAAPDGRVWIASYGYEGASAKAYVDILLPDGTVVSQTEHLPPVDDDLIWRIRFDGDSRPWLVTGKAILVPRADGTWARESTAAGGAAVDSQGASDLVFDAAGQAWVATGDGPALRQSDGTYRHFLRADPPGNPIYRLVFDAAGQAWAALSGPPASTSGLALRRTDGTWQFLGTADGVPDGSIHDVSLSDTGDLWVSAGNRVGRRDPQGRWTSEAPIPDLPMNQLGRLALDPSGQPWVATYSEPGKGGVHGVSRRQGDGQWVSFTESDGISRGSVRSLAFEPSGALWLGLRTWTGLPPINLNRRDVDGRWGQFALPGTDGSIAIDAIAVDQVGNTWFATNAGMARRSADGQWRTWADDPALRFTADVIRVDAAGNIWFGGTSGGVSGRVRVLRVDSTWAKIDAGDGLALDEVADIAFGPDGELWFAGGYGGGISVLAPE